MHFGYGKIDLISETHGFIDFVSELPAVEDLMDREVFIFDIKTEFGNVHATTARSSVKPALSISGGKDPTYRTVMLSMKSVKTLVSQSRRLQPPSLILASQALAGYAHRTLPKLTTSL
jgi:hypothetical protein